MIEPKAYPLLYSTKSSIDVACASLLDKCYYAIEIQLNRTSAPEKAILYTGYSTGAYRSILAPEYHLSKYDHAKYSEARIAVMQKVLTASE